MSKFNLVLAAVSFLYISQSPQKSDRSLKFPKLIVEFTPSVFPHCTYQGHGSLQTIKPIINSIWYSQLFHSYIFLNPPKKVIAP